MDIVLVDVFQEVYNIAMIGNELIYQLPELSELARLLLLDFQG